MSTQRHELILPDLGMGATPVVASCWLVEPRSPVTKGDRLLEVVAGAATVDLPSPASGIVTRLLVSEDDLLTAGQVLAIVMGEADEDAE